MASAGISSQLSSQILRIGGENIGGALQQVNLLLPPLLSGLALALLGCGPALEAGEQTPSKTENGGLGADEVRRLAASLEGHRQAEIAEVAAVAFATSRDGWRKTGVTVAPGQGVSVFAFGELSSFGDSTRPRDLLWVRIGDDETFNVGSEVDSFVANHAGEIELALRPPRVRWASCRGDFPSDFGSTGGVPVDLAAVVVAWQVPLAEGLSAVAKEHGVLAEALADFDARPKLPPGFRSLCYLRNTRVFSAFREGDRRGIRGLAKGTAAIVKKPLDLPLADDAEISFEWRFDTLPALGPESEARYHDYSSIAIELDNGQDITWTWSEHLEAGTIFRCPLEWWDQRETHIVLQSGREGLGEWHRHSLRIADEYERAVGGRRPQRIVGIWFISVGAFGDTTADATYADVSIRSGDRIVEIFE